jgi:hypothetical protein
MRSFVKSSAAVLCGVLMGLIGPGLMWFTSEPLDVRFEQGSQLAGQAGQLGRLVAAVVPTWAWTSLGALAWYTLAAVAMRRWMTGWPRGGDQERAHFYRGLAWAASPGLAAVSPIVAIGLVLAVVVEWVGARLTPDSPDKGPRNRSDAEKVQAKVSPGYVPVRECGCAMCIRAGRQGGVVPHHYGACVPSEGCCCHECQSAREDAKPHKQDVYPVPGCGCSACQALTWLQLQRNYEATCAGMPGKEGSGAGCGPGNPCGQVEVMISH